MYLTIKGIAFAEGEMMVYSLCLNVILVKNGSMVIALVSQRRAFSPTLKERVKVIFVLDVLVLSTLLTRATTKYLKQWKKKNKT